MSFAIAGIRFTFKRRTGTHQAAPAANNAWDEWVQKELNARRTQEFAERARHSAYRIMETNPRFM